jgi:hypothetical protein
MDKFSAQARQAFRLIRIKALLTSHSSPLHLWDGFAIRGGNSFRRKMGIVGLEK